MKRFLLGAALSLSCFVSAQNQKALLEKGVQMVHLLDAQKAEVNPQYFDSMAQKHISASQLNIGWTQIAIKTYGSFKDTSGWMIEGHMLYIGLQFEKGTLDIKFPFNSEGQFTGMFFAPPVNKTRYQIPAYADTSLFVEEDFELHSGPYLLKGKLCKPRGAKKSPLVILSHGSGPQNMDVHIGPNRMFKDIAYGLASSGIAVFRFPKRTFVYGLQSAPDMNKLTVEDEYIEDLLAAIDTFSEYPGIDSKQLYLLGHSEGGILAPRVALRSGKLKGIIMAAAPVTPMDSVLLRQLNYLNDLDSSGTYYRPLKEVEEEVAFLRSDDFDTTADASWLPLGLNAYYWQDILNYHPEEALSQYKGKVLMLFAEKDYQVEMNELQKWKPFIDKKVQTKVIPGCGHGFIPIGNAIGPAQLQVAGSVDPLFIQDVIAFIR
ncbi:MAG: alpha/beta fold hydrolase [Bacteroidetes bacterium]|nr:alpha/beta fold hydrolase [Bacteroidota bacterium]